MGRKAEMVRVIIAEVPMSRIAGMVQEEADAESHFLGRKALDGLELPERSFPVSEGPIVNSFSAQGVTHTIAFASVLGARYGDGVDNSFTKCLFIYKKREPVKVLIYINRYSQDLAENSQDQSENSQTELAKLSGLCHGLC